MIHSTDAGDCHRRSVSQHCTYIRLVVCVQVEESGRPDKLPWSLISAVITDAMVDGFLSGIAFTADPSTGP